MKLTHKEHEARAMLLGRRYDWRDGTYCILSEEGNMLSREMLCADTMEAIKYELAEARREAWDTEDERNMSKPKKETPVARMDEE